MATTIDAVDSTSVTYSRGVSGGTKQVFYSSGTDLSQLDSAVEYIIDEFRGGTTRLGLVTISVPVG